MKRTPRRLLNIFSMALLAFALYLNFVRKEPADASAMNMTSSTNSFSAGKEVKPASEKQPSQTTVLK